MTLQERKIHDSIYKLITPERPVVIVPLRDEGDRDYLQSLIDDAQKKTRAELNRLVRKKAFTKVESDEIFAALSSMCKILDRPDRRAIVAVFPELKDGELYLHGRSIFNGGNWNREM